MPLARFFSLIVFFCLPLLLSCSQSSGSLANSSKTATTNSQWVVAWGASSQNAISSTTNLGGTEQTFRFLVLPTVAGTQERVHFSNYFGTSAITIGAARLSLAESPTGTSPAVDPTHDLPLTFSGNASVTLQPKQEIDSDPVNLTYTFGQWLAVSMYMRGTFPPLTQHNSQISPNFSTVAGAGNTTTDATGTTLTESIEEWFLLSAVEVYGAYDGTVAFFGSSSVDGHNSNFGNTNNYPTPNTAIYTQTNDRPSDWLARSLNTAGYTLGVLNAGLIGNPAGEDTLTSADRNLAAIDRFQHDVVAQPGIKAVIVYTGGVDLRAACVQAPDVEASLTNIVAQAHAAGIRVILATIPPSEYCINAGPQPAPADPYNGDLNSGNENNGSLQRRLVNAWIRSTAINLPGVAAVADFDKVLADPAHPDFYLPNFFSDDLFHPNGAGYGVQNSAIPLSAILGKS